MKIAKMLIVGLLMAVGVNLRAEDAPETKEPKELLQARITYQNSMKAVGDPIKRKYIVQLEDMKKRYGAKGDIESATAIDKEIKGLAVNSDKIEDANIDQKDATPIEPKNKKIAYRSIKVISGAFISGANETNNYVDFEVDKEYKNVKLKYTLLGKGGSNSNGNVVMISNGRDKKIAKWTASDDIPKKGGISSTGKEYLIDIGALDKKLKYKIVFEFVSGAHAVEIGNVELLTP